MQDLLLRIKSLNRDDEIGLSHLLTSYLAKYLILNVLHPNCRFHTHRMSIR